MSEQRRQAIHNFIESGDNVGLLDLFSHIPPEIELDAWELVVKGRAVLLGFEDNPFTLKDAATAFSRALEIDPSYSLALVELGWYYHAVLDDSVRALPFFEKAVEVGRKQLTEAARGRAQCLAETKSVEAAGLSLRNLHSGALQVERLPEEEREWLQDS